MRYVVKTSDFKLNDRQVALAKNLGISQDFLRLLLGRGMSEDELYDYLHPSLDNLSSPFEIEGMQAAVERIRTAIERKEKVLIYGDYDCDGICAISTLMLFLRDKLDAFYFIPDRNKDGYGISVEALEKILSKRAANLVITVDTGITAVEEVEYLKQRNIDVIVTDHHEPQEKIPDCIVVDPKVQRRGFYDLCGAGVALKLVEAIAGREEACKYLDIASIATIADVVPLREDNRIIAYYGLKQITTSPRKGVKMLLNQEHVSSQDVMFRLAPRMNAAGRLNSAMKVVGLFLENDYFLLKTLTEELSRDNATRQELCEKAVEEAMSMLKGADFSDMGIIALYSENWEPGILGIACARLVEEFKRPTVLFAKHGNELRGSARSVPSVNIFELFCSLSQYFTAYGGHSQAAGVSMKEENFSAFLQKANEILLATHQQDDFKHEITCEMQLPIDTDFLRFAKELELMEPTGYQNPKPSFLVSGEALKFEKIGFSNHVKYVGKNIDLIAFSKFSHCLFPRTGKVNFEISLGINSFQNKETAQGIIQSLSFENVCVGKEESRCLNLHHLNHEGRANIQKTDLNTVESYLKVPFGTLFVCFSQEDYDKLVASSSRIGELPVLLATPRCLNPENCVVVCPSEDFDFSFYKRVIICGHPLCDGYSAYLNSVCNECYALGDCLGDYAHITADVLRNIFKEILALSRQSARVSNAHRMYASVCSRYKISEFDFYLALMIFDQLGIVKINEKGVINVNNKSVKLENSVAYRNVLHE